ncbi:glycosyltransferase [Neobacillus vireti]|uniref:glycosyltransferase n=1 Tax=Neobacillus vireti TaxID=220686 RepID=UPI002FFDC4DA
MSVKVSVIIPVYNAEKYITQCIKSLLAQTLDECEFIFINDGSTDNSGNIIKNYKKLDTRIKFLDQENQGVSVARNNGLNLAVGEYIGFVDADDYVNESMFETLYNTAKKNKSDMVNSGFNNVMNGRIETNNLPFKKDTNLREEYIKQVLLPFFLQSDGLNAIWNKLYKTKIIKEKNILFPKYISLGEDGLFNIKFLSFATNVRFIDYSGYNYRVVEGSATRNISKKDYFQRALEVYSMEVPEINKVLPDKQVIKKLKSIKLINSLVSFIHIYFAPSKDVNIYKRFIYVKNMVRNKEVRDALPIYIDSLEEIGQYEKLIISMIKRKYTLGLYLVTAYSRLRNK